MSVDRGATKKRPAKVKTEFQKKVERLEASAAKTSANDAKLSSDAFRAEAFKEYFINTYYKCLDDTVELKLHDRVDKYRAWEIKLTDALGLKFGDVPFICSELHLDKHVKVLSVRIVTTFGVAIRAVSCLDDLNKWRLSVLSSEHVKLTSTYAVPALIPVTKLDQYEACELSKFRKIIYNQEGRFKEDEDRYATRTITKEDCDQDMMELIELTDKRANTVALCHAAWVASRHSIIMKAERAQLTSELNAVEVERTSIAKEREKLKEAQLATEIQAGLLERERTELRFWGVKSLDT